MRKTFLLDAIPDLDNKQFVTCVFLGRSREEQRKLILGLALSCNYMIY